jgi:small-conductance mechanosensitive channel
VAGLSAAEPKDAAGDKEPPSISISEDMGKAIAKEAAGVKEEIQKQARALFTRTPLGWDLETIDYLYTWLLSLPLRVPELLKTVVEHSRILGLAGSLVMLTFIVAVFYSLMGQKRVMRRIEHALHPVQHRFPKSVYPFFIAAVRVLVAAAIPLLLFSAYSLISAAIVYKAVWLRLTGRLLYLWAAGALAIALLRELLTRDLFAVTAVYGKRVFRTAHIVLLYLLIGIALYWAAEDFRFRRDVLAFLRFAISVSVVCVFLILILQKRALMSFLPELPYRSYRKYVEILKRFFYPLVGLSFVLAILWCFGFREFGRTLLVKIWSAVSALVLLTVVYHGLRIGLQRWSEKIPATDESAQAMARSVRVFLVYATAVTAVIIVLNMLGLVGPIERLLSFPVVAVGQTSLSFLILIKAVLIIFFFVFGARLIQGFLDYRVYPSLGVQPGPGFAVNTIIRYSLFGIGALIALDTVGVDLRLILVFAGAIGIGIGLGLQNMAASLISGFTIIFGGKVRKGDWIEVEGRLGEVIDIHVLATRIRTRENIEYLVPNASLVSNTIINHSLSSPMVWVGVEVGVSYGSDPRQVEKILLEVARRESMVSKAMEPRVLFTEFADSSLNFKLLVWTDVRLYAQRIIRSALYFAIFDEFKKAGIEIPFPQRDLHIRSVEGNPDPVLSG